MATSNIGQLYQERNGSGYYAAVFLVNTTTEALPESPLNPPINTSVSEVPAQILVDVHGTPVGTTSNPIVTTATFGGSITVTANAIANAASQNFSNGTSTQLYTDLGGNLKVNVVSGTITSTTAATANAAQQNFANGTSNPLQADQHGALKVNMQNSSFVVTLNGAIPAGSNTIGNVNLASPLPTGANTIGSVNIVGTPSVNAALTSSLPAGTNVIGGITNTQFGISGSLPAGDNFIGNVGITNFPVAETVVVSSLPSGSNAIGSITNTQFIVTQPTAANLQMTPVSDGSYPNKVQISNSVPLSVTNGGTFNVQVTNSVPITATFSGTSINVTQSNSAALQAQVNNNGTFAVQVTNSVPITATFSGSSIQTTQANAALLNSTVVGTGTFAVQVTNSVSHPVTQSNAAALNATVVGTGTFPVQITSSVPLTATLGNSVSLANSTAAIGSINNTGFIASQSNAATLNATVVGTGTFPVQITSSVPLTATLGNSVSLANSVNNIGSINNTGFIASQSNAAALQATVSGTVSVTQSTAGNLNATIVQSNSALLNVSSYTSSAQIQVNPTISTSAYTANNVVGGKLTFAGILRAPTQSGVLQSISIVSKSVQTTGYKVYLFNNNPSNTSWVDHSAPAINAADLPYLIGVYTLGNADSGLGTMTVNVLDNVGQSLYSSGGTSLYAIVTCTGTPTYTSTTDLYITLSVLRD